MRGAVVALVTAAVAVAALEVHVRTAHLLQVNLLPFMGGAAVVAAVVALAVARRFWWLSALVAAVLVPVLDLGYQTARLFLCLFTGCNLE